MKRGEVDWRAQDYTAVGTAEYNPKPSSVFLPLSEDEVECISHYQTQPLRAGPALE